jgi:hypothetical protein
MPLSILTNILDFDIYDLDYNPKTLVFMDKSFYMESPEKPMLEVTPPGFVEARVIPIRANELNIINSSILGLSSLDDFSDLPDGIYTLTYRVCPPEVFYKTKLYLRTVALEYKLWEILTVKDTFTKEEEKKIVLFDRLLKTAKSYAFYGNAVKAQLYYKEAESVINSIKTTC